MQAVYINVARAYPAPISPMKVPSSISLNQPPICPSIAGFVPGSRYVIGTNYRKACDDCFSDLERRTAERRERDERARRSRSLGRPSSRRVVRETGAGATAAAPARSNGAVSSALDAKFSRYSAQNKGETSELLCMG